MEIGQLGPYDLGEPLGKGGMGTVYRATRRDTGEPAAVKALAPNLASLEGFRERFEAEIESLKLLKHPGIVRLLGYGEEDGVLFYAMELVEGTSLEEELHAGRRFTWLEVLDYGIQICRALKHAHDHGVIHRDIKPANLLLDRAGRIKIADFGIARLFGSTQLTAAGGVLGTADYMSPEQTDGRHVTERCDQYSLGGVMYALLAGRPPFRAKNLPEMLQMQRFAEPEPVGRYADGVPQQLERLIMQLLSKDPGDRFPNALVLARHMEAMRRALSRPAADDFALSADSPQSAPIADPSYEAVSMETTRIEPLSPAAPVEPRSPERDEEAAPQPAPEGASPTDERSPDLTGPVSPLQERDAELEVEPPPFRTTGAQHAAKGTAAAAHLQPAARFRTVDEDLHEPEETASGWIIAAQIAALTSVIGALVWGGWYFSQPPTADELYSEIVAVAQQGKVQSLRTVEDQIAEFLTRFPTDDRIEEVAGYQEEIDLSRLEDELYQKASRRLGPESLLPIEQMYLNAIRKAEYDRGEAVEDLRSIVVLYSVEGVNRSPDTEETPEDLPPDGGESDDPAEVNRRVRNCLRLIERRLARLERYTGVQARRQLLVLRRRLDTAQAMESADPAAARSVYRAILRLFEDKPWAADIVQEAEQALHALDTRKPQTQDESPDF